MYSSIIADKYEFEIFQFSHARILTRNSTATPPSTAVSVASTDCAIETTPKNVAQFTLI